MHWSDTNLSLNPSLSLSPCPSSSLGPSCSLNLIVSLNLSLDLTTRSGERHEGGIALKALLGRALHWVLCCLWVQSRRRTLPSRSIFDTNGKPNHDLEGAPRHFHLVDTVDDDILWYHTVRRQE